jgi:hypothetical protein
VPENLQLSDNEETLTITVTYDTRELYGIVIGKREITITRN